MFGTAIDYLYAKAVEKKTAVADPKNNNNKKITIMKANVFLKMNPAICSVIFATLILMTMKTV